MQPKHLIFKPLLALSLSLLGALLYALWASFRFSGEQLAGQYFYVVPIVVPFVAFLLDRVELLPQTHSKQIVLDLLIVGIAMLRGVGQVPVISGHALFLIYALLSTRSRVAQITALFVLLQVIYLKLLWHDWVGLVSGLVIGAAVAAIYRWPRTDATGMPVTRPTI